MRQIYSLLLVDLTRLQFLRPDYSWRLKIGLLKLVFIFLSTFIFKEAFAQSAKNDSLVFKSGYEGGSSSLYSGQSGFNIPLFNLQTKGFSIPVALVYNSSGLKPNIPVSPTGLNWALAAEGQINRKINNLPDDQDALCSSGFAKGFYVGTRPNSSSIDNQMFNFTATLSDACGYYNPGYEYAPDEFSYSCLGHSGKFYITYGGNVKVVADEDVKVDLTNFTTQSLLNYSPQASTIVLTTADGFKFTFGGELKNLDYNYSMPNKDLIESGPVIVTWHLTKVTSPANNEIRFVYRDFNSTISSDHINRVGNEEAYTLNIFLNSTSSYGISTFDGTPHSYSYPAENKDAYRLSKVSFLDRIESDDFSLKFNYSPNTYKFYSNSSNVADAGNFNTYGLKLDSVSLFDPAANLLKRYTLTYQYLGSSYGNRKFLTSVAESGKGTYSLSYYRTNEIPGVHVRNIDYWAYWKGGYDESALLIPTVSQDGSGDQTISSTLRDPDGSYCNVGMLKDVVYPTGGSTTFIYEPHDYSKRLERRAASNFTPSKYTINGITGGARIKSVRDSASADNVIIRNYTYKTDYVNGGSTSSGFLLDWPRYIYELTYSGYLYSEEEHQRQGYSYYVNYNPDEPFVNYAEVTEEINGGGYKVTKFNNYDNTPDYSDYNTHFFTAENSYPYTINLPALYNNKKQGYTLNDRSQERGKVSYEGVYDANHVLLKWQNTGYSTFASGTSNYIVSTKPGYGNMQAYKIYTSPSRVVNESSYTIESPTVGDIRNYTYDANNHSLKTQDINTSNGKTKTRILSYPNDYASGTTFIDSMKIAGQTGLPIEDVTYVSDGTNTSILDGTLVQYYANGKGWPEISYKLETNTPITLSGFKFSSRSIGILPNTGTPAAFSIDTRYQPAVNFRQYDTYGHATEVVPTFWFKGIPSAFKWGYNGQYPIADIKNAKLNEVYTQNFEDNTNIYAFEPNLTRVTNRSHTGLFSGFLSNGTSGEVVSHSNEYININSGISRMFTYSGWVYSTGPSVELVLFMYKAGETGYFTYVDNVLTSETNKWVYLTKNFLVPADVVKMRMRLDNNSAGDVWYDDLAIHPADAQLRTFTYIPFVGKSSEIEGNGNTTYYQYDQFKRLQSIKDQNGNVKKYYDYNFKH